MADLPHLTAALGSYPHTRAIVAGDVASSGVALDVATVEPIHKAFAPMVRHQAYDLSELAVVTAIQALAHGKPIVLLPAVIASRRQRGCLIALASRGIADPRDLRGQRVGVRAYTQTTGMWVRAALFEDAGIGTHDVTSVTHDPAHVAEYRDPAFIEHDDSGRSLPDQLRDGTIDAAILGNDLPKSDEFAPVNRDHAAADAAWVAQHSFTPVNHMVAVSRAAVERDPDAIRAAYALLRDEAARAAPPGITLFGTAALREPLAYILAECRRQELLDRELSVDDILAPAAALLDEAGP